MLCQALRCKNSSSKTPCTKNINGRPIIKLLCLVLWRIVIIVKYIPNAPPIADRVKRVFSLMRHKFLWALILSTMQTIIDIRLISKIYVSRYLILYHQLYFTQIIPLFQSVFLALLLFFFRALIYTTAKYQAYRLPAFGCIRDSRSYQNASPLFVARAEVARKQNH